MMSFSSEFEIARCAGPVGGAETGARPAQPQGFGLREVLIGTAAAAALSLALGGPALAGPDACTTAASVTTCTGNQSDGVTSFSGTLVVKDLTQAIAPTSMTNGINFIGPFGTVTINSNTGAFGITVTDANGIFAFSLGSLPNVSAVTVTSTGNITTFGDDAYGIYGQSNGAGTISVTSTGDIITAGANAYGIFALTSGAITVTSTGNIATLGNGGDGIHVTGGGAVNVTSTGNITAAGSNAAGIYAESSGAVAVTIKSGTVSGGSGSGAGVELVGGTNNTLTNRGTVRALSGLAIEGDTGNNTVNNIGTVTGNVVLGSGTNAFNNQAGAVFNAGATADLGAGNSLANAGTLSPGGVGTIQTTALTGNLAQSATGRLLADIDIAGAASDRVNVSGTAVLAGTIQMQLQNPVLGPWQQTLLSATGGTTHTELSLLASPALHAELVYPNATDVVVQSTGINFLVPGLNGKQTAVSAGLNGAAQSGGLGTPVLSTLLTGFTSLDGYGNALTQLAGEPGTAVSQTSIAATNQFINAIFNDVLGDNGGATTAAQADQANGYAAEPMQSRATKDAYAAVTPRDRAAMFATRWRVWASVYGGNSRVNGDASAGTSTTTSRIFGTVAGASYRLTPNTEVGFALGGAGSNFGLDGALGNGKADMFNTALYARHMIGNGYVAGLLGYSWQDTTTDRTVSITGTDRLHASFAAQALAARLESGWRYATPIIGVTPYAALQSTVVGLPAYGETATSGSSTFALNYAARTVTATRSEIGAKIDKTIQLPDALLTLKAKAAWAHDWNSDPEATATFQTLPGASFTVDGAIPAADSVLVSAEAEMRWLNGFAFSGSFAGEFSDNTQSYEGKVTLRYAFN